MPMASEPGGASVGAPQEDGARDTSHEGSDTSSRRASALNARRNPTRVLQQNPFDLKSYAEVIADAEQLARECKLPEDDWDVLKKGAVLAKAQEDETPFENVPEIMDILREGDKAALWEERKHPWKTLSKAGFCQAAVCAGCAVVQGSDQTIINGAQSFYFDYFGIGVDEPLLRGFINGAPYIAASSVGCWITPYLNHWLGRRMTIFLCCTIALITAITQAISGNWQWFLVSRFFLGLAVGAKSATTPMYAAECAPKSIRGALVMQWQMFTAFGIMLGYISSIVCQPFATWGPNTQFRWMLGSTAFPPGVVMSFIFMLPESPRWLIEKGFAKKSYQSFCIFRSNKLYAARDFYSAYKHYEAQQRLSSQGWKRMFKEIKTRRNLRAAQNAYFVMIMQQFCGVNVLAYYSTKIFTDSGFDQRDALLASLGCGIVNFIGALPAFFTIDYFGRRRLLLLTLPLQGLLLYIAAVALNMEQPGARVAATLTTLYLFMFAYSPGMGPVPFTYSAEVFSLSARSLGMSSATSITWAFNFVISFTFPKMVESMGNSGAFCFYGTCNIIGWVYTYFLLPETKEKSLEALDTVFAGRNRDFASEKWHNLQRTWQKNVLRKDVEPVSQDHELANRTPQSADEEAKVEGTHGRRSLVQNREAPRANHAEEQRQD